MSNNYVCGKTDDFTPGMKITNQEFLEYTMKTEQSKIPNDIDDSNNDFRWFPEENDNPNNLLLVFSLSINVLALVIGIIMIYKG